MANKKKSQQCNNCCGKIMSLLTLLVVGGACYTGYILYNTLYPNVVIPVVNMNRWWGPGSTPSNPDTNIKPFNIHFTDEMIKDLKFRLENHRTFVEPLEGVGFQYGFNTKYLETVLDHWKTNYNFKQREKYLNQYPQYITNIQGLDIHYIRVQPDTRVDAKVVPLLMLHGWPGSVKEFYESIPKLTTVNKYGFVFDLIIPSLPGYGFSKGAVRPGLDAMEIGVVMKNLMSRLGHKQFYIQGGDWGALIAGCMSTLFQKDILGYHSNMLTVATPLANAHLMIGSILPWVYGDQHIQRTYPLGDVFSHLMEETGYFHLQSTKPDTIGVALTDSPAGLAAYIIEKFSTWTNKEFRNSADGRLTDKFTLDDLLDNIMIYWTSNSITTSMRLYSETFNKKWFSLQLDEIPTVVPAWAIKAKNELAYQTDFVIKLKYKNLLGSTVVEDGGHFIAMELSEVFVNDVIRAVHNFRVFHKTKRTEKKSEL